MTEASPSMRFAQKNVLVTGAAAGKGASRVGGDVDEPVRGAAGSRIGDALSLQLGGERNDRSGHQRDWRIHHDVSPSFVGRSRASRAAKEEDNKDLTCTS